MNYLRTDAFIERLDAIIDGDREYMENHIDAGNMYAVMANEGDIEYPVRHYLWMQWDIGPEHDLVVNHGEEIEQWCRENFSMVSRHLYSSRYDGIELAHWELEEIEVSIQLDQLCQDDFTESSARRMLSYLLQHDDYIVRWNGKDEVLIYVSTNVVWTAVVDRPDLESYLRETFGWSYEPGSENNIPCVYYPTN